MARLQEQIKRLKAEVEDVSSAAEPLELELGALRTELLEAEMATTDAVAAAKTDAAREHRELQQRAEALEAKLALAEKALQDQQASNGLDEGLDIAGSRLSAVELRLQKSQALLSGNAAKLAESAKAQQALRVSTARQLEAVQAQDFARQEAATLAVPPAPPPARSPPPRPTPPAAIPLVTSSSVRCLSCNKLLEPSEAATHVCPESGEQSVTSNPTVSNRLSAFFKKN